MPWFIVQTRESRQIEVGQAIRVPDIAEQGNVWGECVVGNGEFALPILLTVVAPEGHVAKGFSGTVVEVEPVQEEPGRGGLQMMKVTVT